MDILATKESSSTVLPAIRFSVRMVSRSPAGQKDIFVPFPFSIYLGCTGMNGCHGNIINSLVFGGSLVNRGLLLLLFYLGGSHSSRTTWGLREEPTPLSNGQV